MDNIFMEEAIRQALEGIEQQHGGPFGSVVVKDGKIIGRGHNQVLAKKDPTCHGEMEAIRDACKNLGTHDLSGAELYTTAEPCPMCLGAILWSNIAKVYYGCNRKDAASLGFRDDAFYDFIAGSSDLLKLREFNRRQCLAVFERYKQMDHNIY